MLLIEKTIERQIVPLHVHTFYPFYMKYSEIPYQRPDITSISITFNELLKAFKSAGNASEQIDLINQINALRNDFDTNAEIAGINYSLDTTNEQYQAEMDYFDDNSPSMHNLVNKYYQALTQSQYRSELEAHFGKQLFRLAELTTRTLSDDIIEDLKKENQLTSEYTKLLASAQIMFEGEERNLSGLVPFFSSTDRKIRKRALQAKSHFFEENAEQFDRIYDDLVKVRTSMAQKLGFKNYVEMGYCRLTRSDYNAQMVANYRNLILKYIVPIASELRQAQAVRHDIEKTLFHDEFIMFPKGNPEPKGSPEWIVDNAEKMYDALSPETSEFFHFMEDNDLMDLVNRKGKAGGGYCTFIPKSKSPFIFSNFNGTQGDIEVLTHEAGHAFQVFCCRNMEVPEYRWPTYEACEIHSMSMEFLTWPWMNLFFESDTQYFKYSHIANSLMFLPYGAAVDEFQHWVYENPNVTPKERKTQWRHLEKKYLPHRTYEDNDFMENGGYWQGQSHLFHNPFYYIDYTLAQVCAFQFWIKAMKDNEGAWIDYLRLCKEGGKRPFLELVELADLKPPFEESCMQEVSGFIKNWLENFDISLLAAEDGVAVEE